MKKLKEWLKGQSKDFIKEVYSDIYKNTRKAISLEELEKLDNKFINNPEGNINGSTSD